MIASICHAGLVSVLLVIRELLVNCFFVFVDTHFPCYTFMIHSPCLWWNTCVIHLLRSTHWIHSPLTHTTKLSSVLGFFEIFWIAIAASTMLFFILCKLILKLDNILHLCWKLAVLLVTATEFEFKFFRILEFCDCGYCICSK